MDIQTAALGPALPLGIAVAVGVLALALAAALGLTWRRPAGQTSPAADPAPPGVYLDDDLPAFREHPPGFPGAGPVPDGMRPRTPAPAAAAGRNPVRSLTAMALLALLLVAAAAVVAGLSQRRPAAAPPEPTPSAAPAEPTPSGRTAAPVPAMSVPAAPSAGQPGAGALAYASVPVGEDGITARMAFNGIVLEQHAVGITATYPSVSVSVADETTALAHVQLPTWNCMSDRAPADPAAAGCRATVPEYADLPAPALQVTRAGGAVRLHGRFPTYTRPNGTGPQYTGRVYELDITLRPGRELPGGWQAVSGELFLGGGRTPSVDDAAVSAMRLGG